MNDGFDAINEQNFQIFWYFDAHLLAHNFLD